MFNLNVEHENFFFLYAAPKSAEMFSLFYPTLPFNFTCMTELDILKKKTCIMIAKPDVLCRNTATFRLTVETFRP